MFSYRETDMSYYGFGGYTFATYSYSETSRLELKLKTRQDLQKERRLTLQKLAKAKGKSRAAIRAAREKLDAVNTQLSALDNPRSARSARRSTVVSGQKPRRRS